MKQEIRHQKRKISHQVMRALSKPIARFYAKPYEDVLAKHGVNYTLDLIDEDIERYGNPYVHTLAVAGILLVAKEKFDVQYERVMR